MTLPLPGNAFVIGGTGMLATATRWIMARSVRTVIVSRHASRFAPDESGQTIPVDASWHDRQFRGEVTHALSQARPITHALLWLHEPEPILDWLLPFLTGARIVLILGSMDGRPVAGEYPVPVTIVQLGSKALPTGRRWLTDAEISDAAIAALSDGVSRIVGDLRPI